MLHVFHIYNAKHSLEHETECNFFPFSLLRIQREMTLKSYHESLGHSVLKSTLRKGEYRQQFAIENIKDRIFGQNFLMPISFNYCDIFGEKVVDENKWCLVLLIADFAKSSILCTCNRFCKHEGHICI